MLLNYLKLSLRLMARNPFFTSINVIGLAIGFASFYILWTYSFSALNSDRFHKDGERIARLALNWRWTDDGGKTWGLEINGNNRASLFPRLKEDFADVESTTRILNQSYFDADLVNHKNKIVLSLTWPTPPLHFFISF